LVAKFVRERLVRSFRFWIATEAAIRHVRFRQQLEPIRAVKFFLAVRQQQLPGEFVDG
jgi:hypothetical protein